MGHRVEVLVAKQWHKVQRSHIDRDQIGVLADLDGAGDVVEAECLGTLASRHFEQIPWVTSRGVLGRELGQQ